MRRRKRMKRKKIRQPEIEIVAPSIAMVSLGCAKNLVDSEDLIGDLYQKEFKLVSEPEHADVVIVNTCGFIQSAIDETMTTLDDMLNLKLNNDVQSVYAMGCYATRGKDDILEAYPELDGVYALNETESLVDHIQSEFQYYPKPKDYLSGIRPVSTTLPHYSFLKIAEGCGRTCTYCTIPSIRGGNVDKSIEELKREASQLAERGVKELNLIAQDTTAYGIDHYGHPHLLELLQELEEVDGLEWIRLLYAYPDNFDDELADFIIESPKMVNYLELPIQHASPSVLRRMNRAGSFNIYERLFDRLRKKAPDFALRTTVIVGFPGETTKEFEEMLEYCREREFDRLGTFVYYREEGTPAYHMKNQVPTELAEERQSLLMSQQRKLHMAKNEKLIGRDIEFIVDEVNEELRKCKGRTWRDAVDIDAAIHVSSSIPLKPGTIATCRVTGSDDYDLIGVI